MEPLTSKRNQEDPHFPAALTDPGSGAPRALMMWVVPLLLLAALATIYFALRTNPVDEQRTRVQGDEVVPALSPGFKR